MRRRCAGRPPCGKDTLGQARSAAIVKPQSQGTEQNMARGQGPALTAGSSCSDTPCPLPCLRLQRLQALNLLLQLLRRDPGVHKPRHHAAAPVHLQVGVRGRRPSCQSEVLLEFEACPSAPAPQCLSHLSFLPTSSQGGRRAGPHAAVAAESAMQYDAWPSSSRRVPHGLAPQAYVYCSPGRA